MRKLVPILVGFAVCAGIWEAVRVGLKLPEVVSPSLVSIAGALGDKAGYLFLELLFTIGESLAGFLIGSTLGCFVAFLFILSTFFRQAAYPIALMIKATPLIAMAPVVILWFGSGLLSKVVMSSILCFFPVLVACFDGLRSTNQSVVELLDMYGATKSQIFWKARIPSALPSLFSGLKVALPMALVGAVIGEYLSATRGIGYVIANSSYHLKTPLMYGALFLVSATGLILFLALILMEKKIAFWKDK